MEEEVLPAADGAGANWCWAGCQRSSQPLLGWVDRVAASRLRSGRRLDEGDTLVSSFDPTLGDSSEMDRNWGFSPFHYIKEKKNPNSANLLDILGRIIKMKLSSSLSRTELDSPC